MSAGAASRVPPEYTLTKKPELVNIQRLPVRAMSDTGTYTNTARITINLPPDMTDMRGAFLSMQIRAILNGGTYIRLSKGAQMCIQRITVFLGSTVIEDITDYNVLAGIFYMASSYQSVIGVDTDGSYTDATRATQTNAGRLYGIKLRLESLKSIIPCQDINLPLRIVMQMADPATYLEYDGSSPVSGVTFSECYFNYYVLRLPQTAHQMLQASIKSGNAQIRYHSWDNYQTNVPTASSQMIQLPFKRQCLNSIVVVYRLQSVVSDPATTGKFTDQFVASATLTGGYVKINAITYPVDQLQWNFNQGYYLSQFAMNSIFNEEFSAKTRQGDTFSAQTQANRVVTAFDLRADSSYSAQDFYNNGVNTAISGNSQALFLQYSGASGALSIDVFGKYESVITVLPMGGISVTN